MTENLYVFAEGALIGELHNTAPLSFSYSEACLAGSIASPFADMIPVQPGAIGTPQVMSFFENLLPEGAQRDFLSARFHVTTVFGLLKKAGWDVAGALVIWPEPSLPDEHACIKSSWSEIKRMIRDPASEEVGSAAEFLKTPNLSGAQIKYVLRMQDDVPYLPVSPSASTHILKPDIQMPVGRVWNSAFNEAFIMRLANLCGLDVAHTAYIQDVEACLVERYDRDTRGDRTIRRHQADICQFSNIPSTEKYESNGGPSFAQCYEIVKVHSSLPVVDCKKLQQWLFFNLCAGNNDSHGKNASLYYIPGKGLRLAPFYDLMCTRVYSGLSGNFAFKIGEHYAPGKITRKDIEDLAVSIGVAPRVMLKLCADMIDRVEKNLPNVMHLFPHVGHNEKRLAERIEQQIGSIAKQMRGRILAESAHDNYEAPAPPSP